MGELEAALREEVEAEVEAKTQLGNVKNLMSGGLTLDEALKLLDINKITMKNIRNLLVIFKHRRF